MSIASLHIPSERLTGGRFSAVLRELGRIWTLAMALDRAYRQGGMAALEPVRLPVSRY